MVSTTGRRVSRGCRTQSRRLHRCHRPRAPCRRQAKTLQRRAMTTRWPHLVPQANTRRPRLRVRRSHPRRVNHRFLLSRRMRNTRRRSPWGGSRRWTPRLDRSTTSIMQARRPSGRGLLGTRKARSRRSRSTSASRSRRKCPQPRWHKAHTLTISARRLRCSLTSISPICSAGSSLRRPCIRITRRCKRRASPRQGCRGCQQHSNCSSSTRCSIITHNLRRMPNRSGWGWARHRHASTLQICGQSSLGITLRPFPGRRRVDLSLMSPMVTSKDNGHF